VPEKDVLGAWPINERDVPVRVLVALYHRRIPLSCSSFVFLQHIDLPLSLTRWPHLRFSSFSRAPSAPSSLSRIPSHCPHAPAPIITLRLTRVYGPLVVDPLVGPLVDPMADGQWRCAVRGGEEDLRRETRGRRRDRARRRRRDKAERSVEKRLKGFSDGPR